MTNLSLFFVRHGGYAGVCLAIVLLVGVAASAQDVAIAAPKKPRTFDLPFVLFEIGANTAEFMDADSSHRGMMRGCRETSSLYGPAPSTARLYGQQMGIAAGFTVGEFLLKKFIHNHPAWAIFPSLRMVGHGAAAAANWGKDCR